MTDQNLLFSPDLTLNLLSKSSPSQLEPFPFKRSRTQPIPTEAFYASQKPSSNGNQNNGNSGSNSSKSSNLSHVPCKFYKQGTCTAGANCTFSHSSDLSSESAVCKYFVKGNCKFGTKCALLHTMSPYGTSATSTGGNGNGGGGSGSGSSNSSNNKRMMASTPPSLPFPRRKTADQMMSFSPSNLDHRSFLHDPFASSAPAVSLLHLHEQQQQLWRNQGRSSSNNTLTHPQDFMGMRSSPRDTQQDPFLGTSPFSSRLSSSVSNSNTIHNNGIMQSPPLRYQPTSFGSLGGLGGGSGHGSGGQDNYDLNDAMLPSSLNDLFTPSELQVRRVRQQEQYPTTNGNSSMDSWSMRDTSSSSFDQRQWRVPFLSKSQQQQQQQQLQPQLHQQQLHYNSLPIDYEDRLIEGTAAINIPGGNLSGSSSSSNDFSLQQPTDLLQQQDDDVQFFMEDDEAVTYDTPSTTTITTDHKTLDMTNSSTTNNNATNNKTYSTYPSLISLPST
ncbi:hypothetical protein MBANPS3_008050 [Mucor bainieri]